MKTIKKLDINELTLKQKLGMLDALFLSPIYSEEEKEYAFELIRRRELGAIWIQQNVPGAYELVKKGARDRGLPNSHNHRCRERNGRI